MIGAWLTAQGLLGIKNLWWVLGIALIAAASATVIAVADNAVEDTLNTAKNAGASEAVVAGQKTTLSQNKDATDAGNEVRDNRGNAMFDECVRSATPATRANCDALRNVTLPD